jgi:hypothetical protein
MKTFATLALAVAAAVSMAGQDCCKTKESAEVAFMKEAQRMMLAAEGKKACCQTTAEKAVAVGEEGCCNAPEAPKPYKVFVAGVGYKFFGCKDSAAKGRKELMATHTKVGKVQKTTAQ